MSREREGSGAAGAEPAIRAFLAVELAEPARRAAAAFMASLREQPANTGLRWVRPENIHVTVRFLGDTAPARLPRLARCVGEAVAGVAPFTLGLGSAQMFPSARRPHVLALHLEPAEPLAALARAVERGVVSAGFAPQERPFRAHLTLARVREGGGLPSLGGTPAPEASPFEVGEVVLFQSRLGPEGSRYTALERFALGGGAAGRPSGPASSSHSNHVPKEPQHGSDQHSGDD